MWWTTRVAHLKYKGQFLGKHLNCHVVSLLTVIYYLPPVALELETNSIKYIRFVATNQEVALFSVPTNPAGYNSTVSRLLECVGRVEDLEIGGGGVRIPSPR